MLAGPPQFVTWHKTSEQLKLAVSANWRFRYW